MMRAGSVVFLALIWAFCTTPVAAHHTYTPFDRTEERTITGTLKEFEWANPHSWIHLLVQNDNGTITQWDFEGGSLIRLVDAGWSRDMMKRGDRIEITYNPKRDGSDGGMFESVKLASGKTMRLQNPPVYFY